MSVLATPLGDVCEIFSGFAWSASKFNQDGRGIPIIRIQNVDAATENGFVYWDEPYEEKFIVRRGELLLTLSGSFRIAAWSGPDALLNQRIVKLTPSPKLDAGWLLHVLRPRLGQIERLGKHALVNNVSLADIRNLGLPLPPLREQRRIADILDRADALRAKRRHALAQLDSLTRSIFLDLFGDPATNAKKWPLLRLSETLTIPLRNGLSPSHSGKVNAKVLTLSAITGSGFDGTAMKTSTFQSIPPADQTVDEADFLICRGNGNIRLVGKGYFPTARMPDVTFPDTMIAARVSPERIERSFLQHVWNTGAVRRQIETLARTTNGTFKVNQTMLEGIIFYAPPVSLQREFAHRVAAVEKLKAAQRASLAELDALFASLQHGAFRGEL